MKNLRELRLENRKTQQEMADLLDIGLSTYHMYEASSRDVPYRVALEIAKMFDVPVEDIFFPTKFTVSKDREKEV